MERKMPMQNENNNSTENTANSPCTADNLNAKSTVIDNTFSKKIGRTKYNVQIFFSKTNKESFNDKLLRLIKNDVASGAKQT